MTAKTFRDLGVDDTLCDALDAQGITHPFPIQELALPLALAGNDLIGQARTGTGKTLAFGLPLLQRLDPDSTTTQALVIVPTRELCVQVHDDLQIGAAKGITTISVYGGTPYEAQIEALTSGVQVVVGTPGRLLDHLNRGNLDLSQVRTLVLDEADEMLDMGFLPDVERLIEACNAERHGMLFSATMPTEIVKLARRYLTHPTFTRADTQQHETAPNVEQHFFSVHRMDKPRVLARILQSPDRGGAYVFVRTKMMADRLVGDLEDLGIPAVPVHGDLRQETREKNLDRFREGKADVLVCTEVAARGIDVSGVSHVINYDCPDDEKMYLHRIGRTARAGGSGVAVTFAEFNEADRLNVIRKAVGATETEVKQIFSTSDELTRLFNLPAQRPWDHLGERGGAKGAEGRGRDGSARRGQTDGRSKNRRQQNETAKPRARARGGDQPRGRAPKGDDGADRQREKAPGGDAGGDQPEAGVGEGRTRSGERKRARRPSGSGSASDTGSPPPGGRTRTRTRTRSRTRGDESGPSRAADRQETSSERETTGGSDPGRSADDRGSGRSRARQRGGSQRDGGSQGGSGSQRDGGSQEGSGSQGGSGTQRGRGSRGGARSRRDEPGSSTPPARDDQQQRRSSSGRERTQRSGSGSRSRSGDDTPSRSGGGSSRSGGNAGRRRSARGQGRADEARDASQPQVARKGRDARGEGDPHLARRVQVDHLP